MRKLIITLAAAALITPATANAADWQSYVLAPPSRTVQPARILDSQGVTSPDALLAPGGGAATLTETTEGATTFPSGTTATASSFHAPNNSSSGQPRTYAPGNAVDGDMSTFWNDDTIGAYPDTLTITAPSAVTLPGITLISSSDGVPVDFTVSTWDGTQFVTRATVTGNTQVTRAVRFSAPVSTTQVRINVTKDQNTSQGEFTRVVEVQPGIVTQPYVDVDFGQELSGKLDLQFGGVSSPAPLVRVATSETKEYLGDHSDFSRSDFSNGDGTDDHTPSANELWHDGDLRGFRYVRIYLSSPGSADVDDVKLNFTPYLGTPDTYKGHFLSSDDLLNRIWYASTYTVELDTDTFTKDTVEPRGAWNAGLDGKRVIQDGAKRDRDPYVGDLAVSDLTDLVSHVDTDPITNVLGDLADHQRADGWIPPASINNYTLSLFDYPLWWVEAVHDYALYTGDTAFVTKYWPNVQKVLNAWYPSQTDANGLLTGTGDYAFLPRSGEVTYYNVLYVKSLRDAARLAESLGDGIDASAWRGRADTVSQAVQSRLWDPKAGAYLDSNTGTPLHPEDGNSIAVLAGVGDNARANSSLDYLAGALSRPWGNAFVDNDTYFGGASDRVYAFLNYPEVAARFKVGKDASALELLRRTWGWMVDHDPGNTVWEATGANGDIANYEQGYSSQAHGWASGAAPALTNSVLGVTPTGNGFTTYTVIPHPGDVAWAQGDVPTPHGTISVSWQHESGIFAMSVKSPAGTTARIGVPTFGRTVNVTLDGAPAQVTTDGAYAYIDGLTPGDHSISASSPTDSTTVSGTVPATLALTLGAPADFGTFTPFVSKDYTAGTTATVTSSAGDAALSVADPSATATGHLVNGAYALPQALQASAGGAFAPVGGWSAPTRLKSYAGPVSNDVVALSFKQSIGATDVLRTGSYAKTLTFVLTTTAP